MDTIDQWFGYCVRALEHVLFFRVYQFPLVVIVLVIGAIFFTLFFRFINIRGMKHAIDIIRGKFDNPKDAGQITHFQALTSALSATIGLGNIAGVAVAVARGGPGAVFWMMLIAVFGMTAKFVSCTLAQMYRQVHSDGSVSGGPMYYLNMGLSKKGFPLLGKVLGTGYAFFIIGGAFGVGNMFQANQSYEIVATQIPFIDTHGWIYGLILAALVGIVIIGGIVRIGHATQRIVPLMCVIYITASVFIIITHLHALPHALMSIVTEAFHPDAMYGGVIGIMVIGIQRAVFSNEAGVGSAAIAHAAAKTKEPVREGFVAMLGPFVDTIVICFMTAMVLLVTADDNKLYQSYVESRGQVHEATVAIEHADNVQDFASAEEHLKMVQQELSEKERGVEFTSAAFATVINWFPVVLLMVVFLFSYSTMISWYYYGEKGWEYLFGLRTLFVYKFFYLGCIVLGTVTKMGNILDFSDMMILACAFPNIIGAFFLLPELKRAVTDYWTRYKQGQFKIYQANVS